MDAATHWKEGSHRPRFPSIDRDLSTDVVVIGGGLTGITTAYLLKEAGVKVVLLERGRCAGADTGHTTAHLTYVARGIVLATARASQRTAKSFPVLRKLRWRDCLLRKTQNM